MPLTQVWLGLGSNIDREQHLLSALRALNKLLIALKISPVFESEPIGVKSNNFYNLVVTGLTNLSLFELNHKLKEIEVDNGRYNLKNKALSLDVDLLLYGELVGDFEQIHLPHKGILTNAYVLLPLSLLSPLQQHIIEQKTFAQLWQEADIKQNLWPITANWLVL